MSVTHDYDESGSELQGRKLFEIISRHLHAPFTLEELGPVVRAGYMDAARDFTKWVLEQKYNQPMLFVSCVDNPESFSPGPVTIIEHDHDEGSECEPPCPVDEARARLFLAEREKRLQQLSAKQIASAVAQQRQWNADHGIGPRPELVCPKGHRLTHPEDIAKRYCGCCREWLPKG